MALTIEALRSTGREAAAHEISRRRRPALGGAEFHRIAVVGIFLILLVGALDYAQAIVVPIAAALLNGLLFGPLQSWLERRGMPSFGAASLIVGGFAAAIAVGARLLFLPFETWSDRLPEMWLALKMKLYTVRGLVLAVQDAAEAVQESAGIEGGGEEAAMGAVQEILGNIAIGVPSVAGQLVLFFAVLFFYLATRGRLRAQLLSLCLGRAARLRAARAIQDAERAISGYLGTVTLINLGLGLATGLALAAIGTPNAGFWGAMAGLLNYVPYLGPALLVALLLGVGLLQEGTGFAPYLPAAIFFGLNFVEANFVTPAVLGRRMTVEPLLVVVSLAAWLWLWGLIGAFLAVPLLLVIQAVTRRLIR